MLTISRNDFAYIKRLWIKYILGNQLLMAVKENGILRQITIRVLGNFTYLCEILSAVRHLATVGIATWELTNQRR